MCSEPHHRDVRLTAGSARQMPSRALEIHGSATPAMIPMYRVAMRTLPLLAALACTPVDLSSDDTNTTTTDSDSTPADTAPVEDEFLSWRIHDDIESLVYVSWQQEGTCTGAVEYSFDKDDWLQSPTQTFAAGAQEVLLLGIPYDTDVLIRLVCDGVTSDTIEAETENLPSGLPEPELVTSDPSQWYDEGRYLYTSINGSSGGWTGGDYWKVIIDRQGRVVWAMETPDSHWTIWAQPSRSGADLMWDDATVWVWSTDEESKVHRMKIDGSIVQTYETPGLHHAWQELPDGSIAWGAHITNNEEYLDRLHPDGTVETIWKCSDYEREVLGQTASSCHSNSWWWHEDTDTWLVSFPSSAGSVRDTVVHMDSAGTTLSSWGHIGDWSFVPPISVFDYQHGVTFTDAGTLLVSTKLHQSHPNYQSSLDTLAVREYTIDYETQTLTEIFSFGSDQGIAGDTAGEAHRLANGNTLHNYGSGARTREITADGTLIWDLKWSSGDSEGSGRLQGRSTWLADLYAFAP